MSSRILAIAAVAAITASAARADEPPSRPHYMAFVGGYSFPEEREFDTKGNGLNLAGIWGIPIGRRFAYETRVFGAVFETGREDSIDYYQYAIEGDLVWAMRKNPGTRFTPFLMAGIGVAHDDLFPDRRDGTAVIYTAGLGFSTKPLTSSGLQLRFGARYVYDTIESGIHEPQISLGFQFPLWRNEPPQIEVREVRVETVREVPRPWIDTDGDGVDDEHDRCPNTPAGLRADATGCLMANQKMELVGVTFEFAQARLTANATTILDRMAENLSSQTGLKLEIAGHTDSVGSERANKLLSLHRAEAVRAYLVSKGVPPGSLIASGYGESQPLVDPELTPDDAEKNRRVELRVLSVAPQPGSQP
ncbi:MAG TPA: OmpA family protein [Steroidobacteraceae bacterium]|nr:OmpA family protein [Steroidobacteraceae bacterium]